MVTYVLTVAMIVLIALAMYLYSGSTYWPLRKKSKRFARKAYSGFAEKVFSGHTIESFAPT